MLNTAKQNVASSAKMSGAMQECLKACSDCRDICLSSIPHCLELGGKHAAPAHIGSLIDCAVICGTSAGFLARRSPQHSQVCRACAAICRECERSCREMGDDAIMRQCADSCARCAGSCERMAA